MTVTIYHNPLCSKSRHVKGLLENRGIEPVVLLYLDDPPSAPELGRILEMLDMEPRELMRQNEKVYKDEGLNDPSLTRDELIAGMIANPILIERPIVVAKGKAVIGRPPEAVLEIL